MAKQLCKSHITKLSKVSEALHNRQKMNYAQLILNVQKQKRIDEAKQLIYQAIRPLNQIS